MRVNVFATCAVIFPSHQISQCYLQYKNIKGVYLKLQIHFQMWHSKFNLELRCWLLNKTEVFLLKEKRCIVLIFSFLGGVGCLFIFLLHSSFECSFLQLKELINTLYNTRKIQSAFFVYRLHSYYHCFVFFYRYTNRETSAWTLMSWFPTNKHARLGKNNNHSSSRSMSQRLWHWSMIPRMRWSYCVQCCKRRSFWII